MRHVKGPYSLFYRVLLQKRPIILSILPAAATPYQRMRHCQKSQCWSHTWFTICFAHVSYNLKIHRVAHTRQSFYHTEKRRSTLTTASCLTCKNSWTRSIRMASYVTTNHVTHTRESFCMHERIVAHKRIRVISSGLISDNESTYVLSACALLLEIAPDPGKRSGIIAVCMSRMIWE